MVLNLPTGEEREQLQACYTGCLDACKAEGLRSIAFCCISTGMFGYTQQLAAEAALEAVQGWVKNPDNQGAVDTIVFDTFTEEDTCIYQATAPGYFIDAST